MNDNNSQEKSKIISINKKFTFEYEFMVGSEKLKTLMKKIGYKKGKHLVFEDPNFEF